MSQPPDERQRQLVRLGFELQSEHELQTGRKVFDDAYVDAALQTGLSPEFLAKAEEELARRERVAQEKSTRRRKRLLLGGALLAGALVVIPVGQRIISGPAPWEQTFDQPGAWGLEVNPGTRAEVAWRAESGRGQVAVVDVDAFAPAAAGTWPVSLEGAVPADAAEDREAVSIDLKGTLPSARVFLEAAANERWVSPPISVQGDWTTHRIPLESFEYQRWGAGRWHPTTWSAPENLGRISVKVGDPASTPEKAGELFIDALRLE